LDEKKLKKLEKEINGNKNSWPFIIFIILFIFILVMFIYFKRKNLK
jgi:polyferredoxin